jgi:hypothetical protein
MQQPRRSSATHPPGHQKNALHLSCNAIAPAHPRPQLRPDVNPLNTAVAESMLRGVQEAARTIGLQIQVLNASTSRGIDEAFDTLARERPDALFVASDSFLAGRRVQLEQIPVRLQHNLRV